MKNDDVDSKSDNNSSNSNIFYIMDGIIDQLNRTKKLFIIMILTIMIIPPIAFMLSFSLLGPPFHSWDRSWTDDRQQDSDSNISFRFVPLIPIIIVLVWLGIGIRQWFVLTKWDKKYKKYKELQQKIDQKLDEGDNKENG